MEKKMKKLSLFMVLIFALVYSSKSQGQYFFKIGGNYSNVINENSEYRMGPTIAFGLEKRVFRFISLVEEADFINKKGVIYQIPAYLSVDRSAVYSFDLNISISYIEFPFLI